MEVLQALALWGKSRKWTLRGSEYSGLDWKDEDVKKPTEEELQVVWEAGKYKYLRKYLDIKDQLDMMYWDKVNGTDNWQESIAAVKLEYPKPEKTQEI